MRCGGFFECGRIVAFYKNWILGWRMVERIRAVDGRVIGGGLRGGSVLLVIIESWLMPVASVMIAMASEMPNEVFVGVV